MFQKPSAAANDTKSVLVVEKNRSPSLQSHCSNEKQSIPLNNDQSEGG
jgi:hypothetical protein